MGQNQDELGQNQDELGQNQDELGQKFDFVPVCFILFSPTFLTHKPMTQDLFYMATDKEQKAEIVKKDNRLIEAKYALTINQQRVIYSIIGKIHVDDDDFEDYTINIAEVADFFRVSKSRSFYSEIQNSAKSLMEKTIDISSGKTRRFTQWLTFLEYNEGEGSMTLRFDKSLKPYLLHLKSNFTQYQLAAVANFKNSYSIRFYEFLKMRQNQGGGGFFFVRYSITELREMLGIKAHEYSLTKDFRVRVIEPALKEIDLQTDLKILEIQYLKTGRAISDIKIYAEPKKQRALAITDVEEPILTPQEKSSESHHIIDSLVSLGFSPEIAKQFKAKYTVKQIERNITYTLTKKQSGKLNDMDIPAYLNKAIVNDYGNVMDIEKQKKEEAKKALEAKKQEEEKKKIELEKKRNSELKAIFHKFDVLDEIDKKMLLEQFVEEKRPLIGIGKSVAKTYSELGIDSCSNKPFKTAFVSFLERHELG